MSFEIRAQTNSWILSEINSLLDELSAQICQCADASKLVEEGLENIAKIRALGAYYKQYIVNPTVADIAIHHYFVDLDGMLCKKESETTASWYCHLNTPFDFYTDELYHNQDISPDTQIACDYHAHKSYLKIPN